MQHWIALTPLPSSVPGIFFDLNPAKRRDLFDSPCHHFVRLSYGPKMDTLKRGLDGIERLVKRHMEMAKERRNGEFVESPDGSDGG